VFALGFVAGTEPGRNRRRVDDDFIRREVEFHLARGGFGAVGGMDQIHLAARAKIAADRARVRFEAARGAEHLADDTDDFQAFDDGSNDRSAGDELFERGVPAFLDVLGVMLLGQFGGDSHQLHGHDVEALVFEPGENAAGQAALDTVGFEQNKRAFHSSASSILMRFPGNRGL
jgi:hypothetical protein